jgi:GDPmannose 4,6-dehydratase
MFGSSWSKLDSGGLRVDISHRPPTLQEMQPGLGQAFQDESTPFAPNSPYAVAKLAAHHMARIYRRSYDLHVSCGIMFNTESERRGEEFVTRKVTRYVGRLRAAHDAGKSLPKLSLGNLSAVRDWSFAGDTARAVLAILERDEPDDYVIATGSAYSVEDFVGRAFRAGGFENWREFVEGGCPTHERPCEVPFLRGRPGKIAHTLGWAPQLDLDGLVQRMVASDILLAGKEQ